MRIPILSDIQQLSMPPRRFLVFAAFNVMSWQCIVGNAMVLLARHIHMRPSWVGFLNSFVPFSMLLVMFAVPLVTRYGSKRVMFTAWMMRNLVSCLVFLLPWALIHGSEYWAGLVLMGATLGFCIMRAMGVGGWFPWLHEVVSEEERGLYFASEAATTQFMNTVIMLGQSFLLLRNPGIWSFLSIYAVGIVAGLISLVWMARVPGGDAVDQGAVTRGSFFLYGPAFRDRRFMVFVITASLCFVATGLLTGSLVMFMRDALKMTDTGIMVLTALNSFWILCTVTPWGRFADHSGSGRAMFMSMIAQSLGALGLLFIAPGSTHGLALLVLLTGAIYLFGGAFWAAVHRAMLNHVDETQRVAYTNVWILGTSIAMGCAPILAGAAIDFWQMAGFHACFAIAGLLGILCAFACDWAVKDGHQGRPMTERLLDPAMPMRVLGDIVLITAGMHESNRGEKEPVEGKTS